MKPFSFHFYFDLYMVKYMYLIFSLSQNFCFNIDESKIKYILYCCQFYFSVLKTVVKIVNV